MSPSRTAALIPVKSFRVGKSRLAGALSDAEREDLARTLAAAVVRACAGLSPHVVCEDPDVAAWARSPGADVIVPPTAGLNAVVRHGVKALGGRGHRRVLVAHADLAEPDSLPELDELDGTVLVPDLTLDGTNVVRVDTAAGFRFSYGPNSFARHLSEAERIGGPVHVVRDHGLALDLDDPGDIDAYLERKSTA